MKKVLIVTYYWPPSGNSGVQRIVKFAKYLPEFGWQPIILTVNMGQYNAIDKSFEREISESAKIFRTPIFEPHTIYKKFTGIKSNEKIPVSATTEKNVGFRKKIAFWMRLNLFIPDARVGWIPFAIKKGKSIIKNENIDLIFSSAPPPSVHLIAKKLSDMSKIKWVADFRDPWTNIHYFENYKRSLISREIDEKLERSVLNSADAVTSVSKLDIEEDYSTKVSDIRKFFYIPNGYDEDDFRKYSSIGINKPIGNKIDFLHIGTIGEERIPKNFFKAVARLKKKNIIKPENFSITFVGNIESSLIDEYKKHGITEHITLIPYVSHEKIFTYMKECTILLLLITNTSRNKGIVPGKTFEYLRSGKPLLVFGSVEGEVAKIVDQTKAGNVIRYEDFDSTYNYLEMLLKDFSNGKFEYNRESDNIVMYERRNLTKQLVDLFEILNAES